MRHTESKRGRGKQQVTYLTSLWIAEQGFRDVKCDTKNQTHIGLSEKDIAKAKQSPEK